MKSIIPHHNHFPKPIHRIWRCFLRCGWIFDSNMKLDSCWWLTSSPSKLSVVTQSAYMICHAVQWYLGCTVTSRWCGVCVLFYQRFKSLNVRPSQLVNFFRIANEHKCRHGVDGIHSSHLLALVHINFQKLCIIVDLEVADSLKMGCNELARTTCGGCEIYNYQFSSRHRR